MRKIKSKILVVDDDAVVCAVNRRILETSGYNILVATNGTDALQMAQTYKPELLLLDVNLPDISGIEVCKQIKADAELRGIFIVLLSGLYTDSDSQVAGLESGADGYITLPIASRELLARVEALLRIRQAEQQQFAINRLALALGESLNLNEVYQTIHKYLRSLVDVWYFIITSYDDQTQMIRAEYAASNHQVHDVSGFPPIPLGKPGEGTQSRVIHSGLALYTPDHQKAIEKSKVRYTIEQDGSVHDELASEKDKEDTTRSVVYLPMKIRGKTVGILQVQSRQLNAYSPGDIDLLSGMANVAAVAIQNARLHANMQRELAEHRQTNEKLRYQAALLESVNDAIVAADAQFHLTAWNAAAEALYGWKAGEVLGRNGVEIMRTEWPAADAEKMRNTIAELGYWRGEATQARKDGSRVPVEMSSLVVRDETGQITGYVSMNRDISERKQAEEILASYSACLETEVGERVRELGAAQEKLMRQERLAVLGQLAGSVAHELRNPLGVISNAVYFLSQIQPDADEKVKEYLEIINNETYTATKIITDLLEFSRLNKSVAREPMAVAGLVGLVLERFPAPADVAVTLDLPEDLPKIYVDPQQVVQVLGNLAVNACQAMPGGGQLVIGGQLSAAGERSFVAIRVQDDGAGIAPKNMNKLFEPLYTTKIHGIGLGLPVCKNLAEANGGHIEVQSQVGHGSTFTLFIPVFKGDS